MGLIRGVGGLISKGVKLAVDKSLEAKREREAQEQALIQAEIDAKNREIAYQNSPAGQQARAQREMLQAQEEAAERATARSREFAKEQEERNAQKIKMINELKGRS